MIDIWVRTCLLSSAPKHQVPGKYINDFFPENLAISGTVYFEKVFTAATIPRVRIKLPFRFNRIKRSSPLYILIARAENIQGPEA